MRSVATRSISFLQSAAMSGEVTDVIGGISAVGDVIPAISATKRGTRMR